jgi:ketosteroid isomerase-like protein
MITSQQSQSPLETQGVIDLVDQLEDMVASARRLPLSTSVVVNEEEALDLIDRIRLALPDELVQARHALVDRERMLAAAHDDAEQLLARAEEEAKRLVGEATEKAQAMLAQHALTEQARAHAETVLADSEERAATVREEADAYARDVMNNLEEHLTRALATVRRGIESLPAASGERRMSLIGRAERKLPRRPARHH